MEYKTSKYSVLILILCQIIITGCEKNHNREDQEIRNVILMIGDGMGLADVNAAMTVSVEPLNIERCDVTGFQKTSSADNYITDSGAAATALATGNKTRNGYIGVDSAGKNLKTIIEIADEHGYATGIVCTSAVTHATPASFIAHQAGRNDYEAIAADFLKTDIDVFIGGGYDNFASRSDHINLTDSLLTSGYEVDTSLSMVLRSDAIKIAGFTAHLHNPYRLDGRGDMLPLSAEKAIDVLSKSAKGFFLMIEGSEIDWAAHANISAKVIDETLDFDKAAGAAIDFAEKDGHTLVLVTADHETGGVTITGGNARLHTVTLGFSTTSHTAVMVPVYAFGPGSEKFKGIYENTELFHKIMRSLGFE